MVWWIYLVRTAVLSKPLAATEKPLRSVRVDGNEGACRYSWFVARGTEVLYELMYVVAFSFFMCIVLVYYDIVTAVDMFQLSCVLSNVSISSELPRLQMFSLRCIIEAMVFVDMFTFCPLSNMCPTAKHPHRKPRAMPSLLLRSNPIWQRPTPRKVITTMLWPPQRR